MPDLSKSLKAENWPEVVDGVLFWQFWQRVSVHTSKKYSPFFLLYNRHPILAIDRRYNLTNDEEIKNPSDSDTSQSVLHSELSIREATHDHARWNIKTAQAKQSSTPNLHSKFYCKIKKGKERKGRKFSYRYIRPYTITTITKTGLCNLINKRGKTLRKKYNVGLMKPLFSEDSSENDEQ